MPKSIKLKNNMYIDSTGIVHNKQLLNEILNSNLNQNIIEVNVPIVEENVATSYQVVDYEIPENGIFLIVGYIHSNYYGQDNRELSINLARNWTVFCQHIGVCNTYVYTLTTTINSLFPFKKGDKLEIYFANSDETKKWSCNGGKIQLIKINSNTY